LSVQTISHDFADGSVCRMVSHVELSMLMLLMFQCYVMSSVPTAWCCLSVCVCLSMYVCLSV